MTCSIILLTLCPIELHFFLFGTNFKKSTLEKNLKYHDLQYTKIAADVFQLWLPTHSPLWCATGEKQAHDIPFPSLRCKPHAARCCHPVWHIVNSFSILCCLLGIHMLFSSLTLQATKHCYPKWNFIRPFPILFHFVGQLPLWNYSLIHDTWHAIT